jgi:hypothetical protein
MANDGHQDTASGPRNDLAHQRTPHGRRLFVLALGALGVVYGDIGTSPLYAFRECFADLENIPVSQANVLGILSLIFWALMVTVTVKYLVFIMRADNNGEGGILALLTLVRSRMPADDRLRTTLIVLGLFGAALLYGDGMITPAISILSAIEGLEVAAPGLRHYVVPLAVGVLIGLFSIQNRGTGLVGNFFGPVTAVWFMTIALLGIPWIVHHPAVLHALDPRLGVEVPDSRRDAGLPLSRRGVPCRDRRRSAVRRHGTLRKTSHSARLGHGRAPVLGRQLFRPGRVVDEQRARHRKPVLLPRPRLGAVPAHRARDRRHRGRFASRHLGRVLADESGTCISTTSPGSKCATHRRKRSGRSTSRS